MIETGKLSFFTTGIRYKAVYDVPSIKDVFLLCSVVVSPPAVPFALVVSVVLRLDGRTVTWQTKISIPLIGYHIFLTMRAELRKKRRKTDANYIQSFYLKKTIDQKSLS